MDENVLDAVCCFDVLSLVHNTPRVVSRQRRPFPTRRVGIGKNPIQRVASETASFDAPRREVYCEPGLKRPRTVQTERYLVLELQALELTSLTQDESSFCVWVIISRVLCITFLHRVRSHSVSVVTQAHN